jgi:hypothetical protein
MQTLKETFTKQEAAEECGTTKRTIERRLKPAGSRPGKHGKETLYARADVFRLREELGYRKPETAITPDSYDTEPETSPDTTRDAQALQPAHLLTVIEQIVTRQREAYEQVIEKQSATAERADPWPEWLTRAEALERSGIPPTYFREVPHIGRGRAVRYHRDDVRALSRRLREEQSAALAALAEGAAPAG